MCKIYNNSDQMLAKDTTAWKVVRFGGATLWPWWPMKGFRSISKPDNRIEIPGYRNRPGKDVRYRVGKTVYSPSGPGLMAFAVNPFLPMHGWKTLYPKPDYRLLEVMIPKGTMIKLGSHDGFDVLITPKLFVVAEVPIE